MGEAKWNHATRGLFFGKRAVMDRLQACADRLSRTGKVDDAGDIGSVRLLVEKGLISPKDGAKTLLREIESGLEDGQDV